MVTVEQRTHTERTYAQAPMAVADAMMVGTTELVTSYAARHPVQTPDGRPPSLTDIAQTFPKNTFMYNMEVVMKNATEKMCQTGSEVAVRFLLDNHSSLFDRIGLIQAEGKLNNGSWRLHELFLVRDTRKIWYAGSPANYEPEVADRKLASRKNQSGTLELFQHPDLDMLLSHIKQSVGGQWPDPSFIEETINTGPFPGNREWSSNYAIPFKRLKRVYSSDQETYDKEEKILLQPYRRGGRVL